MAESIHGRISSRTKKRFQNPLAKFKHLKISTFIWAIMKLLACWVITVPGKSTLIKIITGYYQPTSGEIFFNGKKVENLTVPKARKFRGRNCLPGTSTGRAANPLAEYFPGTRDLQLLGFPGYTTDAGRNTSLDEPIHGLYLRGCQSGFAGRKVFRR